MQPIAAAAAPSTAAGAPAAGAASENADFVGVWTGSSGGWTIKSEDRGTGACAGTSDFSGYTLTGCKVTGNSYVFTINLGTGYHSHNSGHIQGNTVTGSFTDTNGTMATYTATRKAACFVPKLKGLRVEAAKRALKNGDCSAGKVTLHGSSKAAKGKVISSRPGAGTYKAATKVALTVGRGNH